MTYQNLVQTARKQLQDEHIDNATFETHELICACAGLTKGQLLRDLAQEVPRDVLDRFHPLLYRRSQGEPLAYILEQWDFYGLTFHLSKNVLIPRQDTEILAQRGIQLATQNGGKVLDLCAGSGCVGISVAHSVPLIPVILGEISPETRVICEKNIQKHKLAPRVSCLELDALGPATQTGFSLILSNPPYITKEDMVTLPPVVKDHEPHLALFGGDDGLDFYRSIIKHWTAALIPGGHIVFEVGYDQAIAVCSMLDKAGYVEIQSYRDTQKIQRVVEGKLPLSS